MPENVDTRTLNEALAQFMDTGGKSMSQYNRDYLKETMRKWAWYMGDKIGEKSVTPIDPKLWPTMAFMFENQWSITPRYKNVEDLLWEASTTANVVLPVKYTLPIIRAIFPELIMNRIASVQPMPLTSGGTMQLFWMNFYREDNANQNVTVNDSDYADSIENAVPKRMKIGITSQSVSAVKKILNATWSSELAEDLQGAHGLDVESELVNAMAAEILREIEQEVLNEILIGATAGNVNWQYTVAADHTAQEYYQTLYHALIDASTMVYNERYQQPNYIIAGTNVFGYMQKASQFNVVARSAPEGGPIASGVRYQGTFAGLWDVYSTPYINANSAIVSYYPQSMLHSGYIFAPYIPLAAMERVYAETLAYDDADLPGGYVNTDKYTRNVRTRYATYLCAANMFSTIRIHA